MNAFSDPQSRRGVTKGLQNDYFGGVKSRALNKNNTISIAYKSYSTQNRHIPQVFPFGDTLKNGWQAVACQPFFRGFERGTAASNC
jgi:hypothetical protein